MSYMKTIKVPTKIVKTILRAAVGTANLQILSETFTVLRAFGNTLENNKVVPSLSSMYKLLKCFKSFIRLSR
jgi:hypothetical protein